MDGRLVEADWMYVCMYVWRKGSVLLGARFNGWMDGLDGLFTLGLVELLL